MWAAIRLPMLCCGFILLVLPALPAQTPDPVDELRRALQANSPDDDPPPDERFWQQRERLLLGQISALKSPWDLGRALLLRDWKIASRNARLRAQDGNLRGLVGRRFRDAVRGPLREPATNAGVRLALANLLDEIGPRVRALAASPECAGLVGAFATELIRLLDDPDPEVRLAACRALGKVQGNPAAAAGALAGVVRQARSIPDKLAALDGLAFLLDMGDGQPGEVEPPAFRARLAEAARLVLAAGAGLRDSHPAVRQRGLEVVRAAVQAVEQAMPGGSDAACWRPVLQQVRGLGEELARTLTDPQPEVRRVGRKAVYEVACLGRQWARLLDGAEGVRQAGWTPGAADAPDRAYVAEAMRPVVGVLVRGLNDPQAATRLTAVESLEMLGDAAAPAAELLSRSLADPDRFVRWAAVRTLGRLPDLPASPAVERMTPLLVDPDPGVRAAAATALERFGPRAQAAVPTLLRALATGSDAEAQVALLRALARIAGDSARFAVAPVCPLVRSPDARVRRAALTTLGQFGPIAGAALPTMRAALADPDEGVREAARFAVSAVTQGVGGR